MKIKILNSIVMIFFVFFILYAIIINSTKRNNIHQYSSRFKEIYNLYALSKILFYKIVKLRQIMKHSLNFYYDI